MLKPSANQVGGNRTRVNRTSVSAFCIAPVLALVAIASLVFLPLSHRSPSGTPAQSASTNHATQSRNRANYAALQLAFEQNKRQTDAQVKYMARGDGYTLFLTDKDAVFSLRSRAAAKESSVGPRPGMQLHARNSAPKVSHDASKDLTAVVRMRLTGANSPATISASSPMPGKSNYFVGNDASKWQTDVAHYARVSYQSVYPGVDLAFHGAQRQTEFDFIVAPEANPAPIGFHFMGARAIKTDGSGNLVIASAAGNILLHKPVAYQQQNGVRQPVDARFLLKADNQVAFELGSYDRSRELVIDPSAVYLYSTYLGGTGDDEGQGIAFDSTGNAYVTGQTASSNFPTTTGVLQTTLKSTGGNVFVTKLSPDGANLVYSTYVGGSGLPFGDSGNAIAVNLTSGAAYVTGGTSSSDFPTTTGAFQTSFKGSTNNAFVFELSPSGGSLTYSTYLGGTGADYAFGIALATDSSGDVFVVGKTSSTNFPTLNPIQAALLSGSTYGGFVTKLNSTGTALVYSTYLGGSSDGDLASAVALDSSDNAYVTGSTFNTAFPVTTGAYQTTCGSCDTVLGIPSSNGFVTVINAAGSAYVYSTFLGGSDSDKGDGIAVDSTGAAYVTGATTSSNFPTTTGALQTSYGGAGDAFVTKLNPAGSALVYSTYLGGSGFDAGASIALDSSLNAYVTGQTASSNFKTVNPTQPAIGGGNDAFVSEINSAGSHLIFSTYLGGAGDEDDGGNYGAISVDSAGQNIYVTGNTAPPSVGANNFPTQSAVQPAPGGATDAFVVKYTTNATFSLSATTPSAVAPGSQATSTITLTSLNGYNLPVTLSCSVAGTGTPLPTCGSFATNPLTPIAGGATTTLAINTTGPSGANSRPRSIFYAMWLPVAGLSLVGMGLSTSRSRRKKMFGVLMLGLMLTALLLIAACGGSSSSTTTPTCAAAPSVPTGLAASSTTSTGTTLAWTASTVGANCSVSSYTIYQNGTSIGTSATPSFAVTGLTAGTTYSFTVAATDAAGASAQSSALSVTTSTSQTPAGNYTITITGTDANNLSQSAQVTLAVN